MNIVSDVMNRFNNCSSSSLPHVCFPSFYLHFLFFYHRHFYFLVSSLDLLWSYSFSQSSWEIRTSQSVSSQVIVSLRAFHRLDPNVNSLLIHFLHPPHPESTVILSVQSIPID
ncbi:hypothetical protein PFISCL1PPCAC_15404 [Pristionchus fissidentatus]|uniref:G protein-coupled receptor n=1 Tax=Pristionchus fissidentatus TaxID=1538716 RepID=A0AAV5VZD5_9BILA|nr:hypothetical protein PFISCL1PPCAC_15404 [Pristionchus fissidentatus]